MTDNRNIRRVGLLTITLAALTALLLVLCYERGTLVMSTYLAPVMFAFAGMTLLCGRYHKRAELWLGAGFCLWYVLSRVLMGELYLEYSYLYLCNLCTAWMLALPFAHTMQDEKQTGMKIFSWIYFIGFGVVVWLGLFPAMLGQTVRLPYLGTELGLRAEDHRFTIGLHPNGSGVMLLISLMMGVWLLCKYKNRWMILPAVLLMIGLYIGIGFTVSRTVMIQIGCFLGGLAAVACLRLLPWKQLWKKLLVAAPVAAHIAIVIFLSFGLISIGAEKLSEEMPANQEAFSSAAELDSSAYDIPPESFNAVNPQEQSLIADRSFMQDVTTLTGRTDIWYGVFQLMNDEPRTLLTGTLNSDLEDVLTKYTAHTHAHNSLLHALCNMGLPAMLIALFFTLRAAWCALKLIFRKNAAFCDQILAVMLLVWLLGSLTESSLFVESFTSCNIPFFLALGYAIEAERSSKPETITQPRSAKGRGEAGQKATAAC